MGLQTYKDDRGQLTIAEVGKEIPFEVQRIFWIHHVPEGKGRGMHANKVCYEYVVAVQGVVELWLEDASGKQYYRLDRPDKGVIIPPNTWADLFYFSEDAILLVAASHPYQPENYIDSYEDFQKQIGV